MLTASTSDLSRSLPERPDAARYLSALRRLVLLGLQQRVETRPLLSSRRMLIAYLGETMADRREEMVRALYVDGALGLIADEVVAIGTVDQVTFYVREVIRRALETGASGIVLVHNHPSGVAAISDADVAATRDLLRAAQSMGLSLHDHLVIARSGCVSLRADSRIAPKEWCNA